ncbi:D-alanine--D-alanine ligase A [Raoultella terrigena]|uniref:D-alanine--D-alanine ligase n=1 Tax=Raoultella terrigena TaxID=577 RepID=A0A4V6J2K8_RAOTE|nr:D-alanine--D-alanine ligase A [Raoultella terrigena]
MANLPFVGSDVLGSAACMDKDVTKRLLRDAGLSIAPFITLTRANRQRFSFAEVQKTLGLPLFVKPANQGSSVGVSKVNNEEQYQQAVALAFEFDHKVVLNKELRAGRSSVRYWVTMNLRPAPAAKSSSTANSTPTTPSTLTTRGRKSSFRPPLTVKLTDKIRDISVRAYQTLGCSAWRAVGRVPDGR